MKLDRRIRRGEEGSALIIALVFLTTIAVVVASILSFTEVGLRASKAYDFNARARSSYAAEGGVATAIQRYSSTGPCDNFTAPLVGPVGAGVPINGEGAIVRCDGQPPAGAPATQPINSLLSLGTGRSDGIRSTEELRLLGDVFSNSTISTDPEDAMIVQREVSAVGACSGPIQTAPPSPLRCANTSPPAAADPTRGRDPDYNPSTVAVPVRRAVPSCPAGWLVPLEPGYYDDGDALNQLTASSSTCSGKVVWFMPGVYYFDLGFRGGSTTWTVDNERVIVVGGEPKGWNPAAMTLPPIGVPGGCKANGDPGPFGGVQLVAGGGTLIHVKKGRMELCATPSTTEQQIALFGLDRELPDDVHTLEATDITGAGFTSALNAQTIGELPLRAAEATITGAAAPTASLDFNAFMPGVPGGSVISTVGLRISHREDPGPGGAPGDVGPITVTADFDGSSCGPTSPLTLPQMVGPSVGVYTEKQIDLAVTCGLDEPTDLADLAITYTVERAPGATSAPITAKVDGVSVEVQYQTPTTRKPTAVVGTPGFSNPIDALEIGEPSRGVVNGAPVPPTPVPVPEATLSSVGSSASIELAGFADPPVPATATVRSARLRVAHRDQGASSVIVVPFRGGMCGLPLPRRVEVITTDRVDLAKCGPTGTVIGPADVNALTSATFTASLLSGGPAVVQLDGMWLEVTDSSTGPPPPTVRRASTATSTSPGFAAPEVARVIGEQPAPLTSVADLSGGVNSASLQVGGFNRVPVAAGSKINSVKLRVAHQEDGNVASVSGVTGPLPSYPAGCPLAIPISAPGAPVTNELDLRSQCGAASIEELASLDVASYTVTRKAQTASLVPATATEPVAFLNLDKGRAIDGEMATAPLGAGAPPASVKLGGYGLAPAPPAGTAFDAATLRIAHRETGDIAVDGVTAMVTFTDSNVSCSEPRKLTTRIGTTIEEDTINLRDCGLTDPAQLEGLNVVYRVAGGATTGEALLDGVVLDLAYRPPATALLDGIEVVIQSQPPRLRQLCPSPNACDLLMVTPPAADLTTRFVADGTIYAPSAGVDISMFGLNHQVLKRGLIARNIRLGLQPLEGFERPTGAIPPELVTFTAYPDETLDPTLATSSGFADPDNAKILREEPTPLSATANLGGSPNPMSATLALSGYQTDLPSDAIIDSAVLRVRHKDPANTVNVTVKAGATTCVVQDLPASPMEVSEDQIDLIQNVGPPSPDCRLDKPSKLTPITVTYTVATATSTIAELDGITLEILSGPLVRATVTFDRERAKVESWDVLR